MLAFACYSVLVYKRVLSVLWDICICQIKLMIFSGDKVVYSKCEKLSEFSKMVFCTIVSFKRAIQTFTKGIINRRCLLLGV